MSAKKKWHGMPVAEGIQSRIMDFLESNPRSAYSHLQIANAIDANENSVSAQLSDLYHSGWVSKPCVGRFMLPDEPPVEDTGLIWYDPRNTISRNKDQDVKVGDLLMIRCQFFYKGKPVWVDNDDDSHYFKEAKLNLE